MITTSKPLSVALALSLLVAPITAQALAQTAPEAPAISVEEAVAIALQAQAGTIGEAELDQFEGRPAYDIEVVNAAGEEIEFKVDAETGEILNQWTDDDPTDDPVAGSDTDG
ncbi:PepSY domain-containing protein [Ahrensia marina]|uniref:PepSY domain-containing protein n=1 Tax=Ahrensia marina TaxID=1514904 RepID=UPI0035D11F15